MWIRRRRDQAPTDVGEARVLREVATHEMRVLKEQAPYVDRLVAVLVERRKLNHFGDDISVTYTPREAHR